MDRSLLHGGPVRSHQDSRPSQDARSSQDAKSNFAVEPADTGPFKLKKKAVRIVGAADPVLLGAPLSKETPATVASLSSKAPTSLSRPASPSRARQIWTKENDESQSTQNSSKSGPPPPAPALPPPKIELPPRPFALVDSLDHMFVRLSGATPLAPSKTAKGLSSVGSGKSMFSLNEIADSVSTAANLTTLASAEAQSQSDVTLAPLSSERAEDEPIPGHQPPAEASATTSWQGESQNAREAEYLNKAANYLRDLPTSPGDNVHVVRTVALKLHDAFALNPSVHQNDAVEKLRARYVFAVTTFVNQKAKLGLEPLKTHLVKKVLQNSEGDFLQLCAALARGGHIVLENFKQVEGLCQNILDVLPKAEINPSARISSEARPIPDRTKIVASRDDSKPLPCKLTTEKEAVSVYESEEKSDFEEEADNKMQGDRLASMQAWPTQEKREHGAIHRACILKGISGVKSLNQLQALVWGGRLESIQMPEPGSEHALVKFLTPEACQTYLDATENGIEVQSAEKKMIIFVERQAGPSSINDVVQNCIENDVSRCVRATGADDDWSDDALVKLGRGKQSIPRDIDRVKQGKTGKGHHYIEFRFGNIYHALNFRRYLMNDEDWEHCSVKYAKDPCEVARGVHYKDGDE